MSVYKAVSDRDINDKDNKSIIDIISWLNNKLPQEYYLDIGELKIKEDYFKNGIFLFILYMLNFPQNASQGNTSAEGIAKRILETSVHNIDFLPDERKNIDIEQLVQLKSGFEYIYNIVVSCKVELIEFTKKLFREDSVKLEGFLTKLYCLNEEDLKRQLYFLEVKLSKSKEQETNIMFSEDERPAHIDESYITDLACKLGDHIIQKGIIGINNNMISRTWISTVIDESKLHILPTSYNLYEGNSGIGLFLLYLGLVTKKDYFIKTAEAVMQESMNRVAGLYKEERVSTGAFRGISGELYVLSKVQEVTKNDALKEVIAKGIISLKSLVYRSSSVNVIEGTAGILAVLLSMHKTQENSDMRDDLLNLAAIAYKSIVNNIDISKGVRGFSYGEDGVLAFLGEFYRINRSAEVEKTIGDILKLHRSISFEKLTEKLEGWHRGYTGILLSRLILKESGYKDVFIEAEIEEGVRFTIKYGFGNSAYYYNGDIGSLAILEYASRVQKDKKLKNRCDNTFNQLLREVIEPSIEKELWDGDKPIGLMSGITGLGYSLIEKCRGDIVPQVLWLE